MRNVKKNKDTTALRKLIMQLERNLCDALNQNDMTHTFVQAAFTIQAFEMTRLMFDDSDLVSMDIRCRIEGELIHSTLLFTFSTFNDLLRFSGETGERLQLLVCDKLLSNDSPPHRIEAGDAKMVFTTCAIKLSYLIAGDQTCFSAEEVTPISFLQQARNLQSNIRDFNAAQIYQMDTLHTALSEIATMYRYYLGLKELNLNEQSAREKAGLSNDKLFKIALHAAATSK
jgi:hypothetical protein